jgi:membrane protein implicated in regulation of membrane protease activity
MPDNAELWLLAGLILLGLELAAPGAFMMWVGLACLGDGVLTWLLGPAFGTQVLAFAVLCAASVGLGLLLRRPPKASTVNTPQSGLVGRSAQCLSFTGVDGRVRVGDSDWSARLAEGASQPETSDWLDVVDVVGTVLVVQPRTREH